MTRVKTVVNKFGFRQLKNIPSKDELMKYYSEKYYQNDVRYKSSYSVSEIKHINNKILEKISLITTDKTKLIGQSLLEIGSGEGWTLNYLKNLEVDITGIDFSDYGCEQHNPHVLDALIKGDAEMIVEKLINEGREYDIIWIDNVLEHVRNPDVLLKNVFKLAKKGAYLIIDVPNDFSATQLELLEKGNINDAFWVAPPDHLSYFNKEGLNNLCDYTGWKNIDLIGDYPIDFNLFNEAANYNKNKKVGRAAHLSRIDIENFIHEISVDKANNLYRALADLGIGRQIIGVYQKKE